MNFERDFNLSNIHFKHVIERSKEFKDELFKQWEKAPLKADFGLYLADRKEVNKKELDALWERKKGLLKTKELRKKNFQLVAKDYERISKSHSDLYLEFAELPKSKQSKYQIHDITVTPIYRTLDKIFNELQQFKAEVFNPNIDRHKLAADSAKNVNLYLQELGAFASLIIDEIKADSNNINLFAKGSKSELKTLWLSTKTKFDSLLAVSLKQNPENKRGRKKVEVKSAKDYFLIEDMEEVTKLIDGLRKEFRGCKPINFNLLIVALFRKGLLIKGCTNKEYKEAFEKAIEPQPQRQQNFDAFFGKKMSKKNNDKFATILNKISEIQRK